MDSHQGEVFACSKCDKSFKDKSDFKKHYMTHTGERPFACPKCDTSFSHNNYLHNFAYILDINGKVK